MEIKETTFLEAISKLPEVNEIKISEKCKNMSVDFFFSALGFEERAIYVPEELTKNIDFHCSESVYFQYATSTKENTFNERKLREHLGKFSKKVSKLFCDETGFIEQLVDKIKKRIPKVPRPIVLFDVSSCSSKLILTVLKALTELDIKLIILYTDAEKYYPDYNEYMSNPEKFKDELSAGTSRGIDNVIISNDFSGDSKRNPDFIVAFPTFKPGRARNINAEIDESISLETNERIVWIVGDPNMQEGDRRNRKQMLREINGIDDSVTAYEVSTLYYKDTLERLDLIYNKNFLNFHINIADLGSKMQTVAICLFCLLRPDVSVYFAVPNGYNYEGYSIGINKCWEIDFGDSSDLRALLNKVDQIELV